MIRPTLIVSALALAFYLLLPTSLTFTGPGAAMADLMQCMESCIRHEGGNTAANKRCIYAIKGEKTNYLKCIFNRDRSISLNPAYGGFNIRKLLTI